MQWGNNTAVDDLIWCSRVAATLMPPYIMLLLNHLLTYCGDTVMPMNFSSPKIAGCKTV